MRARWKKKWSGLSSKLFNSIGTFFGDTLYYPCTTRRQANVSSWLFAGTSTLKVWMGFSPTSFIRPGRMSTARLENLKSYSLDPFHSLSGGFLEQVRARPRVWGWGWISLLLRWWMDSGCNSIIIFIQVCWKEKRRGWLTFKGPCSSKLTKVYISANPNPKSRSCQIQISI